MVAITLFVLSLGVIVFLFCLKALEETRGVLYFANIRMRLDRNVVVAARHIEDMRLEEQFERLLRDLVRRVEHDAAVILLFLVRLMERRLVTVIAAIRGRRRIEKKESSEYIKSITDHKNGLKKSE